MIDFFLKGGVLMWPILLCSVVALAITLVKALQYRKLTRDLSRSPGEIEKETIPVLTPLLKAIRDGLGEDELAVVGTKQVRDLERGLGSLSLISVITPLLGLTGTVTGMIRAFQIIAAQESQVNPGMLAGGIWEALITTAAGLCVAIPVHVAYHYLEGCMEQIALSMKEVTLVLYRRKRDGV